MPTFPVPPTLHGGGELYYESRGSGPPVLFVPGLGGVGAFWAPQVEAFAPRFTAITMDHRGAGRSTHSRIAYSIDQMVDDTLALLDHLRLERVDFVGHSTGGAIGQRLAVRAPERVGRLVLSATWAKADAYFLRLFELRKSVLREQGVREYTKLGNLLLFPPYYTAANLPAIDAAAEASLPGLAPVEVLVSRIDAICAFDGLDDLPRIRQPALVICARDDIVTPPYFSEALAARIPDARLVLLERGGHFCPGAETAAYNAALAAFLQN